MLRNISHFLLVFDFEEKGIFDDGDGVWEIMCSKLKRWNEKNLRLPTWCFYMFLYVFPLVNYQNVYISFINPWLLLCHSALAIFFRGLTPKCDTLISPRENLSVERQKELTVYENHSQLRPFCLATNKPTVCLCLLVQCLRMINVLSLIVFDYSEVAASVVTRTISRDWLRQWNVNPEAKGCNSIEMAGSWTLLPLNWRWL